MKRISQFIRSAATNWMRVLLVFAIYALCFCRSQTGPKTEIIQLNWFHDPTFAGEYKLAQLRDLNISVKEGGPTVVPINEVISGRATYAVVGIDIFLNYLDDNISSPEAGEIVCIFVDFQRNPVGWILHPDVAASAGFNPSVHSDGRKRNQWFFDQLRIGALKPGDKRGTETTSVWVQWRKKMSLPDTVVVEPVGFDPNVVLLAPAIGYPVYLNEEPYKMESKLGRPVVVLDPVDDGVDLYGNVLICRRDFAKNVPERIKTIQSSLRSSWEAVKADIPTAAKQVATLYSGVNQAVVEKQVQKTVEFVFFRQPKAGWVDTRDDGRLQATLRALQEAGSVSRNLRFTDVLEYFVPVE